MFVLAKCAYVLKFMKASKLRVRVEQIFFRRSVECTRK